jgi:hypothetical protein
LFKVNKRGLIVVKLPALFLLTTYKQQMKRKKALSRLIGETWCELDGAAYDTLSFVELADEGHDEVFIRSAEKATQVLVFRGLYHVPVEQVYRPIEHLSDMTLAEVATLDNSVHGL